MESGLDGADGHADDLCDGGQRHANVVMQDEDRAMLRRESEECALRVSRCSTASLVSGPRPVLDRDLAAAGSSAGTGGPPRRGVHEEPMEPNLEALGIAQPRELTPGKEERLLDGVLRPLPSRRIRYAMA